MLLMLTCPLPKMTLMTMMLTCLTLNSPRPLSNVLLLPVLVPLLTLPMTMMMMPRDESPAF